MPIDESLASHWPIGVSQPEGFDSTNPDHALWFLDMLRKSIGLPWIEVSYEVPWNDDGTPKE